MFIARQPIFNRNKDVYGYELLFRDKNSSKGFDGMSDLLATATVINGLFESGLEALVESKKAFVNFDAAFLNSDLPELIEPEKLVIEVLETVEVNETLIDRLKHFRTKGYKIALDDFIESYDSYPLVDYADIIKFDIMATPLNTIYYDVKKALTSGKILLAEKIETEEEFQSAKEIGFHLFQGFFFSRPNIVGKSCNKTTAKSQYIRLLSELKKPEPSYQILAEIIEKDTRLAYRLMRVIRSRSGDDLVYSIKKALTYMGLNEIERWVSIMMLRDLNEEKPLELMRVSLIRTKFAELIAQKSNLKNIKYEASMMGLFSTIDAMIDQSMEDALTGISLSKSVFDALVLKDGRLSDLYNLIWAYEIGEWGQAKTLALKIGINENLLYREYKNAIKWAGQTMEIMYMD